MCDFSKLEKVKFVLSIDTETWAKISPMDVVYKDGKTYHVFKKDWADVIFTALREILKQIKLKCSFVCKRGKFYKRKDKPYFSITGYCRECANPIVGLCIKKPDDLDQQVLIEFETGLCQEKHWKTRPLTGERKNKALLLLESMTVKQYKDTFAVQALTESGSSQIEVLYDSYIYKACRQKAINLKLGLHKFSGKPIESCIAITLAFPTVIRQLSTVPFNILYWSENQTKLYREALKYNAPITIDASGRFVLRVHIHDTHGTAYIFLYVIVVRINGKIYPICQMLSERHDVCTIALWLLEWLQSGAPVPNEVVVDCSLALLNAISLAFNSRPFSTYIDTCYEVLFEKSNKLPVCFLRRDRNHLISTLCKLKVFKKGAEFNFLLKDFYVRSLAFFLEIDDVGMFEEAVISMFVICMSESLQPGSDAWKRKKFLDEKIKTFNYQETYNVTENGDRRVYQKQSETNQEHQREEFEAYVDPLKLDGKDLPEISKMSKYIQGLLSRAVLLCDNGASNDFMNANDYYLPEFVPYLINLFSQVYLLSFIKKT